MRYNELYTEKKEKNYLLVNIIERTDVSFFFKFNN